MVFNVTEDPGSAQRRFTSGRTRGAVPQNAVQELSPPIGQPVMRPPKWALPPRGVLIAERTSMFESPSPDARTKRMDLQVDDPEFLQALVMAKQAAQILHSTEPNKIPPGEWTLGTLPSSSLSTVDHYAASRTDSPAAARGGAPLQRPSPPPKILLGVPPPPPRLSSRKTRSTSACQVGAADEAPLSNAQERCRASSDVLSCGTMASASDDAVAAMALVASSPSAVLNAQIWLHKQMCAAELTDLMDDLDAYNPHVAAELQPWRTALSWAVRAPPHGAMCARRYPADRTPPRKLPSVPRLTRALPTAATADATAAPALRRRLSVGGFYRRPAAAYARGGPAHGENGAADSDLTGTTNARESPTPYNQPPPPLPPPRRRLGGTPTAAPLSAPPALEVTPDVSSSSLLQLGVPQSMLLPLPTALPPPPPPRRRRDTTIWL